MNTKKSKNIFKLTETSFDNLEMANVLIALLLKGLNNDKSTQIALEKINTLLNSTVENILEIQNELR